MYASLFSLFFFSFVFLPPLGVSRGRGGCQEGGDAELTSKGKRNEVRWGGWQRGARCFISLSPPFLQELKEERDAPGLLTIFYPAFYDMCELVFLYSFLLIYSSVEGFFDAGMLLIAFRGGGGGGFNYSSNGVQLDEWQGKKQEK